MPTARELLEQADALMRRNRMPGGEAQSRPLDIPVLTEVVEAPMQATDVPSSEQRNALPVGESSEPWRRPDVESPMPVLALDDVPVLTDVVEEIEAPTIEGTFDDEEPSILDAARAEAAGVEAGEMRGSRETMPSDGVEPARARGHSAAPAPDDPTVSAQGQPDELDELALDELEAPSAPLPATAAVASARSLATHGEVSVTSDGQTEDDDDEHWDALAEEIRMQVLQRIDMFTDSGLHEQLTARLRPIVDRASADLVATINQQVRQLLRAYVAEAVEHEIEKWRHGGG